MANYLTNFFSQLIIDFPTLFLQFVVVIFSFFFILRDKEELADYIKSLLPFSKEVETKLFKYSKDITSSVLYGQVIIVFCLIASTIDNFLRPMIVSKKTHLHSSIVLIGMVGGAFLFGILGFILGPLILSYLLIILEIYRNRKTSGIFIQQA